MRDIAPMVCALFGGRVHRNYRFLYGYSGGLVDAISE